MSNRSYAYNYGEIDAKKWMIAHLGTRASRPPSSFASRARAADCSGWNRAGLRWFKTKHRWFETKHRWFKTKHRWFKTKHRWFKTKHRWFEMKHRWFKTKHRWFEMKHRWFEMKHRWFKTNMDARWSYGRRSPRRPDSEQLGIKVDTFSDTPPAALSALVEALPTTREELMA